MRSSWSFSGRASAPRRRRARCDGRFEPRRVDRLQQVVDRVHLERLDGVLVEGGHENDGDGRLPIRPAARATSKPVSPGICTSRNTRSGVSRPMASSASRPLPACADHLHAADLVEQVAQLFPRQLLVVDHDGAQQVASGTGPLLAAPIIGISSVTEVPLPERARQPQLTLRAVDHAQPLVDVAEADAARERRRPAARPTCRARRRRPR